ncbi:SGNH/GDSL hydrolase family protein [Marinomonas mediterranea]|jgi:Lysophospholipase L1 and related esterases|uniref:Lipolytic protein G-D-S-L family n=1 Tax=Marinomonas mediterranea (strain ATCC 700492 / JCM 21426 / NBRC 103028 / MMB-1) TaxID=717774 RepID=F2JXL5_MARM1|nr:SGNH/GDSL hydrolase family protein [Marinomonas mediterranea]ADZ93013.1 lipolytic protein G-D-S-L family [Marinomonas mediterranea MMB-1]WCN10924.1 arylesterase [Marinomonas mediterranea]WCN14986.1 arylesterase [Marinomonas mediterranea]WCN19030.1 arylesterase [Marinomonas mediterranea MMB-1]
MATVLCYGDSLTWGTVPNGGRYMKPLRWTSILEELLGNDHQVINYGLPGRTTIWEDPFRDGRNGVSYIQAALETFGPVDVLVLMLGTNDLKRHFNVGAFEAAKGVEKIIERVRMPNSQDFPSPSIIVVAPPNITEPTGDMAETFSGAVEKSQYFHQHYQNMAMRNDCLFLNAAGVLQASTADGVHLDTNGNEALAKALVPFIEKLLG